LTDSTAALHRSPASLAKETLEAAELDGTAQRSQEKALSQRSEARRNFFLCVLNGAIFEVAKGLIDPALVLSTWFVGRLTESNLLIGLVAPLGVAGWALPQVFFSARIQRMQRKMPVYTAAAVVRVIVWALLALMVWLIDAPALLLPAFFVIYAIAQLASGPAGLTFFDIVARTIPARRRGRLFAMRLFIGGAMGLGSSWVVTHVLGHPALPFPRDIALLVAFYSALLIPAFATFIAVREPPAAMTNETVALKEQLRRGWRLLQEDRIYRRYIAVRTLLALTGIALPFYSVYAKNVLGAEAAMAGLYVATSTGARLLSNLAWGGISDRKGNLLVLRLLAAGRGLTLFLALALVISASLLKLEGGWLPYLAIPLFLLDSALFPAGILSGSNFLVELVSEAERPIYLGMTNTLMGVATLLSVLGGLLVDWLGYAGLFAVALVLCVLGLMLTAGLPEPRRNQQISE
jgi:MFS family permease